MPSKEELRNQLIDKLKELFQLDQPELDFGFYRIMHAKAEEVEEYLTKDLPRALEDALGEVSQEKVEEYKQAHVEALQNAREYGVDDPESSPPVEEAWEAYQAIKDSSEHEAEIYDHLYRFFSRYYDRGDFISRRYRVRETDSRAAPYAIPYNGEEVKLHWANHDQYYIKTGEYFSNFSFDLRQVKEVEQKREQGELGFGDENDEPLRVHFRVVDAEEGEHDNVKTDGKKVRKFCPWPDNPVELNDDSELVINFESFFQKSQGEYIYDSEMAARLKDIYGTGPGKSDMEPLAAAHMVYDALEDLKDLDSDYESLLKLVPPPANKATPPLLAKYIEKFAAKNTMDFFIHKDLGGFLQRELDFYIKNEVMRLDDIQSAEAPRVENYLSKLKALRTVAQDIIAFLAQLENFQKKLWLKKKFVVETNYCVTLDRVPNELYHEIAVNEAQLDQWVELFAVHEMESIQTDHSQALTVEFLKENQNLVLDTAFFDASFTQRLLASVDDFDEQCNGVILNSENFQALGFLQRKWSRLIDMTYIDPPYNTENDNFIYKDSYKHSTWLSMISNRLRRVCKLTSDSSFLSISIDDHEMASLRTLLDKELAAGSFDTQIIIQSNKRGQTYQDIAKTHEYLLFYGLGAESKANQLPREDGSGDGQDEQGVYERAWIRKEGSSWAERIA